ncbi:hypothetical protein Prudu_009294, partial [Prunus dulcis]
PDPNSALEFESDPVRVRHLGNNFYIKGRARKTEKWPGGGFMCTSTAWGRKTLKNVSVTQSQPEQQTGRIQGTIVSLIRIPGSHGPGVLETREANVKCTDKTKGKLDVRRHHQIRRQHILKANCFYN